MIGELTRAEIDECLHMQVVGRLGLHGSGLTYVVPITYVYDGAGVVYFHTLDGLKMQMMRANPDVCFEVDTVEDLGNWQSIIAWGRVEELRGKEAAGALARFMAGVAPFITGESTTPSHRLPSAATLGKLRNELIVCRIELSKLTGRYERHDHHHTRHEPRSTELTSA